MKVFLKIWDGFFSIVLGILAIIFGLAFIIECFQIFVWGFVHIFK